MHHQIPSPSYDRRRLLTHFGSVTALAAISSLLKQDSFGRPIEHPNDATHHTPRAKRIIYLCQSGAPSQLDLFDYKPMTRKYQGTDLPESVRRGQRLTTMTSKQEAFPVAASTFKFAKHGRCGAWFSELLPHMASLADDWCVIRSMHTEAINHDPAITLLQTGFQQPGRPSMGAWVDYGLGSENHDLPAFVALVSANIRTGQPLYSRLWGSGFLPSIHQGVRLRSVGDPVLHLSNPTGITAQVRGNIIREINALNHVQSRDLGDPEIETRIRQYEMAFRMQTSVPDLVNLEDEPEHVLAAYGSDVNQPGTYAANCLLARRLAERGVRFIQLFHRGWDQHLNLPRDLRRQCQSTDQPTAALIRDLKQRGMLDDTLIIWGGEFGRTVYCQGELTADNYGRDHHPRCFTMLLAGAGVKAGLTYGETDAFSYNILSNPVHIHDLNATVLHCLGIDHHRLTFKFQGRHHRLTDVHGNILHDLLT